MNVELEFRTALLPVFSLESIDEILPEHSLVNDIGADSLDFVEIIYVIEQNFGITLKTSQILVGGENISNEDIFDDGQLSQKGYEIICAKFPEKAELVKPGATKIDLFRTITVGDIIKIIEQKLSEAK